jgi:hypothetical protein
MDVLRTLENSDEVSVLKDVKYFVMFDLEYNPKPEKNFVSLGYDDFKGKLIKYLEDPKNLLVDCLTCDGDNLEAFENNILHVDKLIFPGSFNEFGRNDDIKEDLTFDKFVEYIWRGDVYYYSMWGFYLF